MSDTLVVPAVPAALDAVPLLPDDVRARVEAALAAMRRGTPVVLCDDDDRENEADLIVAAERLDVPTMAMLIRECSGIVCLCITPVHASALGLRPMVEHNRSRFSTAFTVTIEAREGVRTGVSAADRVRTIEAAVSGGREDIVSPGHIFPLIARAGGVLERRGHTEGSVDLARLAGLRPAAVLCELMNADGSMMTGDALAHFAQERGLPMLTIEELVLYREACGI
ncbi:MAG: 3,4-dihydroxy-2-butanone-4-phosphate synthase [Rhodocyclaceae bacterium]